MVSIFQSGTRFRERKHWHLLERPLLHAPPAQPTQLWKCVRREPSTFISSPRPSLGPYVLTQNLLPPSVEGASLLGLSPGCQLAPSHPTAQRCLSSQGCPQGSTAPASEAHRCTQNTCRVSAPLSARTRCLLQEALLGEYGGHRGGRHPLDESVRLICPDITEQPGHHHGAAWTSRSRGSAKGRGRRGPRRAQTASPG